MNEFLWQHYQGLLEQSPTHAQRHCVSCWYKASLAPFPADWSSSLCPLCARQIKQRFPLLKRPLGFAKGRKTP